jgi:hypothetical protein
VIGILLGIWVHWTEGFQGTEFIVTDQVKIKQKPLAIQPLWEVDGSIGCLHLWFCARVAKIPSIQLRGRWDQFFQTATLVYNSCKIWSIKKRNGYSKCLSFTPSHQWLDWLSRWSVPGRITLLLPHEIARASLLVAVMFDCCCKVLPLSCTVAWLWLQRVASEWQSCSILLECGCNVWCLSDSLALLPGCTVWHVCDWLTWREAVQLGSLSDGSTHRARAGATAVSYSCSTKSVASFRPQACGTWNSNFNGNGSALQIWTVCYNWPSNIFQNLNFKLWMYMFIIKMCLEYQYLHNAG